jgi:hypothetical protein
VDIEEEEALPPASALKKMCKLWCRERKMPTLAEGELVMLHSGFCKYSPVFKAFNLL